MIRRAARHALLLIALSCTLPAAAARGETPPPTAPPDHTSFLFSAFAVIWVALWIYLVAIHRGQRRVEKMLERMEREGRPEKSGGIR